MLSFVNNINTRKNNLYNLDEISNDNFLASYKIMNGPSNLLSSDDTSIYSTTSSY
jgi:hypothetical protein